MKSDADAAESFAQYLKFWFDSLGLIPAKAGEIAERKGYQIGTTKIQNILNGIYANHQMRQIEGLALLINRPKEEVFMAALGFHSSLTELREYKESDTAQLWQLLESLPSKDRKFYERALKLLADDMHRESNKSGNG